MGICQWPPHLSNAMLAVQQDHQPRPSSDLLETTLAPWTSPAALRMLIARIQGKCMQGIVNLWHRASSMAVETARSTLVRIDVLGV